MGSEQNSPANEYLHSDDHLPVCMNVDSNDWEDSFLARLGQPSSLEKMIMKILMGSRYQHQNHVNE